MDTIVKDIFKQQNEFKQIIYRNNDNCIYPKLNNLNSLLKELNEKIKPKNLKCFIRNVSRKELSNVKPMKEFLKLEILNKEPNIELLILEPAFICRKCIPSKIFDSEDELRTHQGEGGHRFEAKRVKNLSLGVLGKSLLASMPIQQVNQPVKELTIIKNNTTCVAVPLFELFDKSGALAEINNRIKSINLKCHIVKETGEELNLLEFEPAFMCRQCTNKIFDTEEELKEHRKKDEMERKKYLDEISNPYEKRQQEHDKYLKSRDRPR